MVRSAEGAAFLPQNTAINAGPSGLSEKEFVDPRNHGLTAAAIKCRAFGADAKPQLSGSP